MAKYDERFKREVVKRYKPGRCGCKSVAREYGLDAGTADGDAAELAVVPDVQLQNLLWSFNQGYAKHWSDRELRVLTGCDGWDALLKKAAADFAKACDTVNAAIDGSLVNPVEPPKPAPVIAARMPELADDDDAPWLPSYYLHDAPGPEVPSCAL